MKWLPLLSVLALLLVSCSGSGDGKNSDPDASADLDTDSDSDSDSDTDSDADTDTDTDTDDPLLCDEDHPDHTVGLLMCTPDATPGYTLFSPLGSQTTYLIDIHGREINSWATDYRPAMSAYLLDNGHLIRAANIAASGEVVHPFGTSGRGGRIQEFDWDGNLVWQYDYFGETHLQHHDVEPMPNGNVMLIAWDLFPADEAIAAGLDPLSPAGDLWPDSLVEVQPVGADDGDIVWQWHLRDHLVQNSDPAKPNYGQPASHPELVDINYSTSLVVPQDWTHFNSVDYNESLDQVVVSVHSMDEIWIIDHSTTTLEAAGHAGGNSGMGGDLLYRWGNPYAYGKGSSESHLLFGQHDARWIPEGMSGEGDLLIFNNGKNRPGGSHSTVDQIVPPLNSGQAYDLDPGDTYGPDDVSWFYESDPVEDFFSSAISGAHRMESGNTLICDGSHGWFFEVTPAGETVWSYQNPVVHGEPVHQGTTDGASGTSVFRITRYPKDHPAFEGRDLTPGEVIELPFE